jgi:hypothetical protein
VTMPFVSKKLYDSPTGVHLRNQAKRHRSKS